MRDRLLGAPVRQRGAGSGIGMGEKPGQEHFPLCSYRHAEPAELPAGTCADNEEKREINGMNSPTVGMKIRQSSEKYFANRRKSVVFFENTVYTIEERLI